MQQNRLDSLKGKHFSRLTAENILLNYPGVKVSHILFDSDEYIYSKEDAKIYTEEGYLFEDWHSYGPGQHNGFRGRVEGLWDHDWFLYEEKA